VNAKQLEQPVFQAGPSRCESGHGCQSQKSHHRPHFGGGTRIEKSMRGSGAARGQGASAFRNPPSYLSSSSRSTSVTRTRRTKSIEMECHLTSEPGLGANECVPSGKWCKSTAFRQPSLATQERVTAAAPKHEVRRRAFVLCFASYVSASHARVVQRELSAL